MHHLTIERNLRICSILPLPFLCLRSVLSLIFSICTKIVLGEVILHPTQSFTFSEHFSTLSLT